MNRRDFLKMTLAGAALLPINRILAGDSHSGTLLSRNLQTDTKTLVLWHWGPDPLTSAPDSDEGKWFAWKLDTFRAQNPDENIELKVEQRGWDEELRTAMLAAISGGNAPDVTLGEAYVLEFTSLGAFSPLNINPDDFPFGTIAGGFLDGQIYGVPAMTSTFALEINPGVLEKSGLDPEFVPQTWDELLEAAQSVHEAGGRGENWHGFTVWGPTPGNYGSALRMMPWVNRTGALMGSDDGLTASFNDERAVAAYDLMRELFKTTDPTFAFGEREAGVGSGVWSGQGAFMLSFGLDAQRAADFGGETVFRRIPLPQSGGILSNTVVGNITYSALKDGPNPELAVKWCEMLATAEAQYAIAQIRGFWLPARKDVLADSTVLDTPLYEGIREKNRMVADTLLEEATHPAPPFQKNPSRIWEAWNDTFGAMLLSNAPTKALLDDLQAQAERLLS